MNDRANIPVSLPHDDPTPSYWHSPPSSIANHSSPEFPSETDTLIIGSGISGTSIAWNLLQSPRFKGKNVCMVEARTACSGATGRNGGHTKSASYRSFHTNVSTLGLPEAVKIARFEYENIHSLHQFAREYNIECESWQGDTVDIIYSRNEFDAGVRAIEEMRNAMGSKEEMETVSRYQIWTKEEARERWGVKYEEFVGAISYAAGSISAYKFVTGLLKLCLERGLKLFTNTPATKFAKIDGRWQVTTKRGTITAKRIVLATNGYTARLWPGFQGSVVPVRGQVQAHRPGRSMPESGLPGTYSFIYDGGYEYMIPRPLSVPGFGGDIVIGGGITRGENGGLFEIGTTDDGVVTTAIREYLAETTPRFFGDMWGGDHEDGRVRKEWTGIMGYSSDGYPFVGAVPEADGLWVAASFQGHGMVLCWGVARALVQMMEGMNEEEEVRKWFPDCFEVSRERMEGRFEGIH